MSDKVMAITAACCLSAGIVLIVYALAYRASRLGDALERLRTPVTAVQRLEEPETSVERFLWERTRGLAVLIPATTRKRLQIQGRSLSDFLVEKIAFAIIGVVTPAVMSGILQSAGLVNSALPYLSSLLIGVAAFFLPDVKLRMGSKARIADTAESLLTYFDLIVLERLSNKSATQSLHAAANLLDSPFFVEIRACLENARLQQRPPWDDLTALAQEWEQPELADIVDVMKLDEQGAALSETLRSRVAELRNNQLMAMKVDAQKISERMSLPMVIPAMIFAAVFLIPPLLRMTG